MAAKFKKGQEIYAFSFNDEKCEARYKILVVDSCGASQMHMRRVDDGSMTKCRAYAPYEDYFLVSEVDDPIKLGTYLAEKLRDKLIAYWEAKLSGSDGSTAWCDSEAGREIARKRIVQFVRVIPSCIVSPY